MTLSCNLLKILKIETVASFFKAYAACFRTTRWGIHKTFFWVEIQSSVMKF